jgi:hypothetical protein
MKSYSRKDHTAPVPTSSSVSALPTLEEVGPMVRPTSMSMKVASTSSHGRPVFLSHCRSPSPRLPLLSQSPSMMTLALVAPVVPSPPPLPVRSTSPSSQATWPPLFLLAHITSGSHVSSCSRSSFVEDMFKRSTRCITMDSEDDHWHEYATPVLERQKLMIRTSRYGLLVCPL